mmetsp:Transcript_60498/g.100427  ORF Transcript_60498/g.100427 Transcript_60498/m.100427 type:complete len:102 (-) Transcript_60498:1268-1573(-)
MIDIGCTTVELCQLSMPRPFYLSELMSFEVSLSDRSWMVSTQPPPTFGTNSTMHSDSSANAIDAAEEATPMQATTGQPMKYARSARQGEPCDSTSTESIDA